MKFTNYEEIKKREWNMQVRIDNECFFNESNYSDLNTIFSLFKEEQHNWIDCDLEEIKKSYWYQELGVKDKILIEKIFKNSIRKTIKKTISVSNCINNKFNVPASKLYLKQPLTIVVENYEYEPVFINCIIKNFGSDLTYAKNNHFLKFENGGGANDNTIRGMINELFNNPVFSNDNKEEYLRCFVIKDSDREFCRINEDGSIQEQELPTSKTEFLINNKVPFHILYKREKENYMPETILNGFITSERRKKKKIKDFVINFSALSCHQKDFFDIEKGFIESKSNPKKIKDKTKLSKEVFDLYSNLSDERYRKIGFGLPFSNFKSEFSKHFNNVSKEDLEKRIRHQPKLKSKVNPNDKTERNEFEHIIHEIKYLL